MQRGVAETAEAFEKNGGDVILDRFGKTPESFYGSALMVIQMLLRPEQIAYMFNLTLYGGSSRKICPESEPAGALWAAIWNLCVVGEPLSLENVDRVLPKNDACQNVFWRLLEENIPKIKSNEYVLHFVKTACSFFFCAQQFQAPPRFSAAQAGRDSMGISDPFKEGWNARFGFV